MAQQEIFYATLAERLTQLGYDVKMFTEYQFRINGRLDVYPVNRRWHDIKENQRGDYEDIFDFCKKLFRNQEGTTPITIIDINKELRNLPNGTPIVRRYKRPKMSAMLISEKEAQMVDHTMSAEILNYPVSSCRDASGQRVYYAIQEVDKETLDHLLLIRRKEWDEEKARAILDALTESDLRWLKNRKEAVDNALANVRSLPWWKRLLNQF